MVNYTKRITPWGIIFLIYVSFATHSLSQPKHSDINDMVFTFFDAMKNHDTTTITRSFYDDTVILTSHSKNKEGVSMLRKIPITEFVTSIKNAKGVKLDERIKNITIKQDGTMAVATMDYDFYINDQFSHCGMNVFHFLHTKNGWKITGISDSRRRASCQK